MEKVLLNLLDQNLDHIRSASFLAYSCFCRFFPVKAVLPRVIESLNLIIFCLQIGCETSMSAGRKFFVLITLRSSFWPSDKTVSDGGGSIALGWDDLQQVLKGW